MNDKFLHITYGLNRSYPSPDIPEDLAWEEMRKLLDEDDQKPGAPPPLITSPNRNNRYWEFGLFIFFITGVICYMNGSKLRQVLIKNRSEHVNYKKVNDQNKTVEWNFRTSDSINNLPNNDQALRSTTSEIKTASGEFITANGEISGMKNKMKRPKEISMPGILVYPAVSNSKNTQAIIINNKKIAENSIDGNKGNLKPDTSHLKSSGSLINQLVKSDKTEKRKSIPPTSLQDDKKSKRFALSAGLGFNQFFILGSQQHSNYNSGGTVGALSDYIPVPFIRWNINKKLYLQLEMQINTPQYTRQLLAKHEIINDTSRPGQITENNSVYINKLFYFNIPMSIYYSPFQNFYVGTGLQFSQLTNGVGLFKGQEYSPLSPDTLSNSKFASIKDDPVYKEIKTIEWRILLDVNYQWQNLVLGVRYNQALNNFINVQISSTQVTQARNNSIQLYLRYILWKNRKTKELFAR